MLIDDKSMNFSLSGVFVFFNWGCWGDAICIADSYRIIDNYKSPELGLNLSGS